MFDTNVKLIRELKEFVSIVSSFAVDGVPKNVREPTHSLVSRRRLVSDKRHSTEKLPQFT
jgi:hypothetical protein